MKLIVIGKNNIARLNKFVEYVLYILGYTIAFLFMQLFFDTIVVDSEHKILVSFLAVCLVCVLDKTIKPIILHFTIPITASSLGIFYFVVNTAILKLADAILGDLLTFESIWKLFFLSIALTISNLVIDFFIIKPIMRRVK